MSTTSNNAQTASSDTKEDLSWGRVLIAGGTDWANVGKKDKSGKSLVDQDTHPDLYEAHVMRPLCNVPIASIYGSGCASHFVAIDTAGGAWLWGRNLTSSLGLDGEQFAVLPCGNPRRVTASGFGAPRGTRFVHAACGRHHTLLVGSNGQVWAAGTNTYSQCGLPSAKPEIKTFTLVNNLPTTDDPVIQASAGVTFSAVLTASGKVYAFGSAEHGQLGGGRTGEDIGAYRKVTFDIVDKPEEPVRGLEDKVIVQIASGNQHTVALDKDGYVYAWGNSGYCRTGMGDQKELLTAKIVQGRFINDTESLRAWKIFAGPTCSMVIDRQRMFYIAGKFKMTGDGSSGQPYTTFKPLEDISPYKAETAAAGGSANFAIAPDDDAEEKGVHMTVAWGQQCSYGELALGNDAAMSATRPTRIEPLSGVRVFSVVAGQYSTVFLAKPGEALSSLPRHPIVDHPAECIVCGQDRGEDDSPLECEKCETPYHLGCLNPPLTAVPEDEWFCQRCSTETQFEAELPEEPAANGHAAPTPTNGDSLKRKAEDIADGEEEDSDAKKPKLE